MRKLIVICVSWMLLVCALPINAQPQTGILDDKQLLDGYAQKYGAEPKNILLAMIEDETLPYYKEAAAVRVFREQFSQEVFSREKSTIEKNLLRNLNRDESPFVEVEIMHTLCLMDRYRYFNATVPSLIRKLDHYNQTVNELAYRALNEIIKTGNNRQREAKIVFNTLRKVLFLSRKRLATVTEPDTRLKQKLELVRWAIKVLGTEYLRSLPTEVINLL